MAKNSAFFDILTDVFKYILLALISSYLHFSNQMWPKRLDIVETAFLKKK